MDSVLLGVLRSEHPPALKVALIRHLVQKSAHLPVPEDDCQRIMAAGVTILQSADTDGLAEMGALVIRQWGQHNGAVLERCALPVLLEPLLAGPVPLPPRVGPALLGWLLDRLPAQQAGPLLAATRLLLANHAAHPAHTADTLSGLAGLMLDWPQCRPRFEEAVTLSMALIRAVAAQRMPDQSGQIAAFVSQMERVGLLFQQLFSSTQTVIRAMDTLYDVMTTDTGGAPVSPALNVALQAVPLKLIGPACSQLGSLKSGGGAETTCQGISLLCDWLLVWPRASRLAVWVGSLVREAAGSGYTTDLHRLVLARIDKLFQGLTLPAIRRSVFPVVSLMLLGFQQSPAAFFKVLPRVPALLDQLRQEGGADGADFSQLADLVQTLLRLHPSCVQRYAGVVRSLQGRSPPPPSVMASLLVSSAWTDPSARPEPPAGEPVAEAVPAGTAGSAQLRRGLVNLGNTCYMNAVLQALFHSDQLCSEVLSARPSPSRPHLAALQRVFAFLAFSERPAYSPVEFQRAALPPWFERGRQHDCSEFLRYLLDAMHEEERVPAAAVPVPPAVTSTPSAAPLPPRPAAAPRARDDTSVPRPAAAGRPRSRRRHRSCDTPSAPGGSEWPPLVPLSDLVSEDVVMTETDGGGLAGGAGAAADNVRTSGTDGCGERDTGDDRLTRTGDGGDALGGADRETGTGDGGDVGAEESPGDPAEPAAGLVRRLLTGRAETTYTCCTCGSVSRHVDRVTDLHLALPEALTRPQTVAGEADRTDSLPVFGPDPRPAGLEGSVADAGPGPETPTGMQVDSQPTAVPGQEQQRGSGQEQQRGSGQEQQQGSGQEQQQGSGQEQTQHYGPDPEPRAGPNVETQSEPGSKPGTQPSPAPDTQLGPEPDPELQYGPDLEPAPQFGPAAEPQFGPDPLPQFGPAPEPWSGETSDVQPEMDLTVSDLLHHYLAPERLCGENQYHCATCAGLRDADRQLRLLTPPRHLVVSLVRFVFDRRTGVRRKVLAPVGLSERLSVPLAGRPPAQYRLYAAIVHAGQSLDAGHYFSFCRTSGGGDCGGGGGADGADGADGGWWRLDDTSAVPVTAAAALGRSRRSTDAAYTLLYRLAGAGGRPPALAALPGPLQAAVDGDNALYRRERQGRPVSALPLLQDGRPPPGAGCGGDSGHAGPSFVC